MRTLALWLITKTSKCPPVSLRSLHFTNFITPIRLNYSISSKSICSIKPATQIISDVLTENNLIRSSNKNNASIIGVCARAYMNKQMVMTPIISYHRGTDDAPHRVLCWVCFCLTLFLLSLHSEQHLDWSRIWSTLIPILTLVLIPNLINTHPDTDSDLSLSLIPNLTLILIPTLTDSNLRSGPWPESQILVINLSDFLTSNLVQIWILNLPWSKSRIWSWS